MELLLNLVWLLLALPAYCLWRGTRPAYAGRRATSLQCLLTLGCMLVILFPVISATDDLHVMQAEMEESPAGKRCVCHSSHEKVAHDSGHSQPAVLPAAFTQEYRDWNWHRPSLFTTSRSALFVLHRATRAPPAVSLA